MVPEVSNTQRSKNTEGRDRSRRSRSVSPRHNRSCRRPHKGGTASSSRSRSVSTSVVESKVVPKKSKKQRRQEKPQDQDEKVQSPKTEVEIEPSFCPRGHGQLMTRLQEGESLFRCEQCLNLYCEWCLQDITRQKYQHFCCYSFEDQGISLQDWFTVDKCFLGKWAGERTNTCIQAECKHCPLQQKKTKDAIRVWQSGFLP